jgi:hypothetical protein
MDNTIAAVASAFFAPAILRQHDCQVLLHRKYR